MKSHQEPHRCCDDLIDDGGTPNGSPTTLGYMDRHSVEDQTDQARRSRKIEARRAQADLLLTATNQDTLSTQIQLALRDLDEADWLNATGCLGESSAGMVDALLMMAGRRLDCVRTLLA